MFQPFQNDRTNQPSNSQPGDFVNRNLLRIDPKSGIASRSQFAAPATMAAGAAQVTPNAASFAQKLAALGDIGAATGKSTPNSVADPKQKVQQYITPTQYLDAHGKTLPQYRMGIGHRILGTLANFANGFAGNRAQPIYVGPGALNNRYYQDERQRRQNLEAAQQERNAIQGPANLRDVIDYRTVGQDPTTKEWFGQTYGKEKRKIAPPPYAASGEQDDEENNDEQM